MTATVDKATPASLVRAHLVAEYGRLWCEIVQADEVLARIACSTSPTEIEALLRERFDELERKFLERVREMAIAIAPPGNG